MSTQRLNPFAPPPLKPSGAPMAGLRASQTGPNAIGIGFGTQGQVICGAAFALLLSLAAWLWFLATNGLVPALLLAALLACAGACLAGCARSLESARGAAMGLALYAGALICALAAGAAVLSGCLHLLIAPPPAASLLRLGVWTGYWLGCTALLALLPKSRTAAIVQIWGGRVLAVMAMLVALLGGFSLYNPWWGMVPAPVPGLPILNSLLLGYGAPVAMLLVGAQFWRRSGEAWLRASAQRVGACLAALWLTLEVRRAFTGPDLTNAVTPSLGAWLWTAALLGLALAASWMLRGAAGSDSAPRQGGRAASHAQPNESTHLNVRASLLLRQRQAASGRAAQQAKRSDPNWAPPP